MGGLYTDVSNNDYSYIIANYKYTYQTTQGSLIRYGGPITGPLLNLTSLTSTANVSSLYPDASYSLFESVQNNSTNQTFSGVSPTTTFITTYLNPAQTFVDIGFSISGIILSAKLVGNNLSGDLANAVINNIIYNGLTQLTSNSFTSPIHYIDSRGKLTADSTRLLDISCSIVRGANAAVNSGIVSYNGFPASTPSTQTLNGITITPGTPTDVYSSYETQFKGFYLKTGNNTITLNNSFFINSNDKTTLSTRQRQYEKDGSTIKITNNYITNSFYYDSSLNITPTISSISSSIRSDTKIQVSGIWVLHGTLGLNATTSITNIGNYFYRNGDILTYSPISPVVSETNLTNVTSGKISGIQLGTSVTFTNTGTPAINYTIPASYSKSFALSAIGYNCRGVGSASVSASTINAIFDPLSAALLLNSANYPASILLTGTTNPTNTGCRIKTGVTDPAGSFVNKLPTSSGSNANSLYDNTQNIISLEELQIANGLYVTKSYTGVSQCCYLNYSTYLYNTTNAYNYSTISGTASDYRYASFAWKFASSTSAYTHITFYINGLTNQPSRYLMFYRIENLNKPTDNPANFAEGNLNTTWIDATNATTSTLLGGSNKYNTALICAGANTAKINTYSGGVYTAFTLIPETPVGTNDNIYVYLRIALPMNENIGFSHIRALLSSTAP